MPNSIKNVCVCGQVWRPSHEDWMGLYGAGSDDNDGYTLRACVPSHGLFQAGLTLHVC